MCLFSWRSSAPAGHPGTQVNVFPIFSYITPLSVNRPPGTDVQVYVHIASICFISVSLLDMTSANLLRKSVPQTFGRTVSQLYLHLYQN